MVEPAAPMSPRARRALRRLGLAAPLLSIRGSGPGGRIRERDVLAAAAAGAAAASPSAASAPARGRRLAIARATADSAATIPHFFLQTTVDASALLAFKRGLAAAAGQERPTLTDMLLRAIGIGLAAAPAANAVWRDEDVATIERPRVGLVVSHAGGLAIPVLEPSSLARTAQERAAAVAAVGRGAPPSATPCASTLSNLGAGRVDAFSAIIPLGQSSILAVGRLANRPFAIGDALAARPTLVLTLSADHRVLDGVPAADYLGAIVDALEHPERLA